MLNRDGNPIQLSGSCRIGSNGTPTESPDNNTDSQITGSTDPGSSVLGESVRGILMAIEQSRTQIEQMQISSLAAEQYTNFQSKKFNQLQFA